MLVHGYRIKEIAKKLHISERTVTTHQENIYQKLNIHHRASLIQFSPYYFQFLDTLSPRERTIAQLLAQDLCSIDISLQLNLSIETIYSYRKSINRKFKNIKSKYDVLGILAQKEISLN
ncbi:helix-turn-helix transcriptional regulator [Acinetobacter sp. Ac_5812]|uniref:response regulator transcription factor n=1 Tax=Acinetobacter sp. Ac_5812 TaxID=1848937 RepID=UPI00148F630B|nr:helix-turn-helix transcriptional regulator [Acinetobacter sp. Ac_5812]NNP69229.1 two-component response regulator [Acinetobacter sp. Ac_5812]